MMLVVVKGEQRQLLEKVEVNVEDIVRKMWIVFCFFQGLGLAGSCEGR